MLPAAAEALTEAAQLFDRSGQLWSEVAERALHTVDSLGTYAELAEDRMELICAGSATPEEITQLNERIDGLAGQGAATDPLGEAGRHALFDELGDRVDQCHTLERQATTILADLP